MAEQLVTKQRLPISVTKASGAEYEPQTTTVLAEAFSTDPVINYFLLRLPSSAKPAARHHLFHILFTAARLNNALFYESSTVPPSSSPSPSQPAFQCCAVFLSPGQRTDNLGIKEWCTLLSCGLLSLLWTVGLATFFRVLFEYPGLAERAKKKVLRPDETYYYVLMVGTEERYREKGLCAALMTELQGLAQAEGKPVWLEATTRASRDVYRKLGFEDVGVECVLGRGKCDKEGGEAKGSEAAGVEIFPMVWWPRGYVRSDEGKGK